MSAVDYEREFLQVEHIPYARPIDDSHLITIDADGENITISYIEWGGFVRHLIDMTRMRVSYYNQHSLREWRTRAVQELGIPGGVANGIVSDIATYLYFLTDSN